MANKKEVHLGLISSITPEFHLKDLLQIMIGASILAIPVGFTEETWHLGNILPAVNIMGIFILSVLFISAFVYYNYHRHHKLKKHWNEFVKRVISTYIFSFIVVSLILILIQRAPWATDYVLALKRTIIVAFPASMSAAIADMIK